MSGWTYVETQKDTNNLLEKAFSFHYSVHRTLNYTSGAYVNADRSMHLVADVWQVSRCFDSQWCDTSEMVIEGVPHLTYGLQETTLRQMSQLVTHYKRCIHIL